MSPSIPAGCPAPWHHLPRRNHTRRPHRHSPSTWTTLTAIKAEWFSEAAGSLVLAFHPGLTAGIDIHMERHGVAADGAVFDVVLMGPGGDVHWHDDLLATRIAEVDGFLMG